VKCCAWVSVLARDAVIYGVAVTITDTSGSGWFVKGNSSTKHRAIDGSRTPDDDPSLVEKIELSEAAN
jgi:hypothetical protein